MKLSVRVDGDHQLKLVRDFLKSKFGSLMVETKMDVVPRGWVQLRISGKDKDVAENYLIQRIGEASPRLEEVERFFTIKGYIVFVEKTELHIDVGISSPSSIDAVISLKNLQTQLVDGRKMALKRIAGLFGLVENLPLMVKITRIETEKSRVEAMLPESQIVLYRNWTKSLLDRLVVLGASSGEVRHAVNRTRSNRDVVDVESLGMLEHAVVCKFGTDAIGLIPKIGRRLPNATFAVFEPQKVLSLFADY